VSCLEVDKIDDAGSQSPDQALRNRDQTSSFSSNSQRKPGPKEERLVIPESDAALAKLLKKRSQKA
jgi:hypothetical protein